MTGSELFKFLEFKGRLEEELQKRRIKAQQGAKNEIFAEIDLLEGVIKELDRLEEREISRPTRF